MFNDLTNFSVKRSGKQAFGFYLAWTGFIILLGGVLGFLFGILFINQPLNFHQELSIGSRIGAVVALIVCIYFGIRINLAKGVLSKFKNNILLVFNAFLALLGGALLGMIIPAYFTTQKSVSKKILLELDK